MYNIISILFNFNINSKTSNKEVVTIDLEKAEQFVPYFHSRNQKVICYFSGGTMQSTRTIDYNDYLKANIALPKISGWGNHFIDIRQKSKLQPLIKRRMQRARSYNCDGVEVDSIDLYNHNVPGFTKEDTITFGKWIAETAKDVGIAVGLKNSAGCVNALEPYFDFAVVESCADDVNVCNNFTKFTSNNKAVFVVHYKEYGYGLSGSSLSRLIKEAGNRRFSCIITDEPVHGKSQSYDCSKGTPINPNEKPKVTTTTTTTTTAAATTTTSTIASVTNTTVTAGATSNPTDPNAKTTPDVNSTPGLSNIVPGNSTANAAPKEVGSAVGHAVGGNNKNEKNEEEGGNGIGGIIVGIFAAGGVATAAVAGFVFLKKHKKFSSDDEEFSLD